MSVATDEKVSKFLSFTGSGDTSQAASYLEMCSGDLETAVGLFMEHNQSGDGVRDASRGRSDLGGIGSAAEAALGAVPAQDVRAPDATRTMRLMDDVDMGTHASFQLMSAMTDEGLAQSAFAGSPRGHNKAREMVNAAAAAASAEGRRSSDGHIVDGQDEHENDSDDGLELDDHRKSSSLAPERLADIFAPPMHLIHKAGGFQGARSVAKDSKRWLLVNLQRDSEFACHALNRDVWRDDLVVNLIREGFIFWQAFDTTAEGGTYSERYQVHDYPHLAIIDPRTGRLLWRKEGWTQETPLTAEVFAEIAMDFCSRNSFDRPPTSYRPPGTSKASLTRPSKRAMHELSEDEQLKVAMKASLRNGECRGQLMASEHLDEDEVVVLDPRDLKPAAIQTNEMDAGEIDSNVFLQGLQSLNVGNEPEKGARLQLRMPDGKRKVRKFSPTDTVRIVYAFLAQTSEEAPNRDREFTLMAGFPPRDLMADLDSTIESCKLAGEAITMRWK